MAKKKAQTQAQTQAQTPVTTTREETARDELYKDLTEGSQDDHDGVYAITIEEAPVSLRDFLPDYRYRFDGSGATGGDEFVSGLAKFLETNAYLVMDDPPVRTFADGFARAVAVAALYIDSLAVNPP